MLEEKIKDLMKEKDLQQRKLRFIKWLFCNLHILTRDELVRVCILFVTFLDDEKIINSIMKKLC